MSTRRILVFMVPSNGNRSQGFKVRCASNHLIGRVAPSCYQLGAPTDPDMRDSRIRLLKSWFRNATSTLMDNTRLRQREPLKQLVEPLPAPMGFS
jgi:hypothetical protein